MMMKSINYLNQSNQSIVIRRIYNLYLHLSSLQLVLTLEMNSLTFRINECGWTSPPRMINRPPERLPSKPSTTTNFINIPKEIDVERKPVVLRKMNFFERIQNEITQLKEDYAKKFSRDRTFIDYEINRIVNDQRITFDKLERCVVNQQRKYPIKRKH
jgi:hypothetical protein